MPEIVNEFLLVVDLEATCDRVQLPNSERDSQSPTSSTSTRQPPMRVYFRGQMAPRARAACGAMAAPLTVTYGLLDSFNMGES